MQNISSSFTGCPHLLHLNSVFIFFPQLVQNISSIFTIFPQYLQVFAEWLFLVAAIPDTPALGVSNVGTFSSIFELVDVLSDKTG